jgi:hypothetical protein
LGQELGCRHPRDGPEKAMGQTPAGENLYLASS